MQLTPRRLALVVSVALGLLLMPYVAFSVAPVPSLRTLALNPNLYDLPVDLGFRPNPHGYSFANYGGVNAEDLTVSDLRRAFGDAAVCQAVVSGVCVERPLASLWRTYAIATMAFGHCDGMATTSLRFFKGLDQPADFQPGASSAYQLQLGNARRQIAYYFIRQLTDPVARYKWQIKQNTPTQILNLLRSRLSDKTDPATLFVRQAGQGGHAITPYQIVSQGGGIYRVMVYDNNYPGDAGRYVVVNTSTNAWSYNLGTASSPLVWQGNAATQSMGIVPISQYAQPMTCPWCAGLQTQAGAFGQIWSNLGDTLLVTNAQGERFGYVNGQLIREIGEAYEVTADGGLGAGAPIAYAVPLDGEQTIAISGASLLQAEPGQVSLFGPGYAVTADDLSLQANDLDQLTVSADGTAVSYEADTAREVSLSLAYSGGSASTQAELIGADVGAGKTLSATASAASGTLSVSSSNAGSGSYSLVFTVTTVAGTQSFFHENITFGSGATHIVDYSGLLSGGDQVTLKIDQDSDGTIDQTVTLQNRPNAVFIPSTMR